MQDCIGTIDGTHVLCVPRQENSETWINRKGHHSQNVLAACSFDMKFTYMLAGYEGSCHDAKMLEETIAFHGFPIPPPGKLICHMIEVFINNKVIKKILDLC